ncbi:MAG TPA: lamin tail domain-containing protein [Verrucomicrobiae bacterium]|nr:lamin tail domain-containing protein [Verrucomicrobiae bacterium]
MSIFSKVRVFIFTIAGVSLAATNLTAQTTLVSTNAVWKYKDDGSDQGTAWIASGFPDGSWASGPAVLGFGDGDEATTNASGHITYYFRHSFNVASPGAFTSVRARLMRDDGAIVYLNGTELFRNNMPTGAVDYLTLAASTASDDGHSFSVSHISPASFVAGANVLAVEVHQAATNSSDIRFALELIGNARPSISISSPTNNQTITASSIIVSGTSIPGGPGIPLIEVFASGTKVGQSTNFDFAVAWPSAAPGTYALTAKITDGAGLAATSAPVNVTIQAPPATIILARGSSWKYHNLNSNLFTLQPNWNQPAYDDSAANGWAGPGPAPLGNNVDSGVQSCATVLDIGSTTRYPVVFFRRTLNLTGNPNAYQGLILRVQADDSAAIYLNGSLLYNDAVPSPGTFTYGGRAAGLPDELLYREFTVPSTGLVAGVNVLAVENHNSSDTSTDLQFDMEIEGIVDNSTPTASYTPTPGAVLLQLNSINVVFSEAVAGVNAADLLINGEPATGLTMLNPNDFTFTFPSPTTGAVQVAWAPNHGIADLSPQANPFAGGQWSYTYDPNASTRPNVIITEFMAQNDNGIKDEDGDRRDWIELYNVGPLTANMDGFFLTDSKTNLSRWRLPGVTIPANNYMIVWASGKNKRTLPLHTDFRLPAGGGYLALVDPQTNVVSEFDPYPAQSSDVSFGRDAADPNLVGYFNTATPGAQNSTSGGGFLQEPVFSLANGVYTNDALTLTITSPDGGQIRWTRDGSIPTATSTLYSGPITFTTNVTIKARVFLNSSGLFPSPVGSRVFVMLDSTARDFNSNLPILIISSEGKAIPAGLPPGSTNRPKGSFTVIDTKYGRASLRDDPQFMGLGAFELFGQTSVGFTKKPHRIEIQDELGNDRSVGVLGMPADADWRLRNPFSDKCMMNDFMAFELFEEMGNYSVRRRLVEVFSDSDGGKLTYPGDYHGILCLVENIEVNKDRVNIAKLTPAHTNEPAISGGWMLKYDKDSAGDIEIQTTGGGGFTRLGNTTQVGRGLKIHEPKPSQLGTVGNPTTTFAMLSDSGKIQVRWLTNWFAQMEKALYATTWRTATGTNHWSYYIDGDSFADFHWIVEFPKQIDGYRLSNYWQKDRNGKLKFAPIWDWNLSFGNADYLNGGKTNGWYYLDTGELDHPYLRRLICGTTASTGTTGDPDFNQKIADRWGVLRTNAFNIDRVLGRIDEVAAMCSEAAVRDFARFPRLYPAIYDSSRGPGSVWPNPNGLPTWDVDYVHPTNYAGIISEMKKWTSGRFNWIDAQLTPPPTLSASDGMISNGYTLTINGAPGATIYYTLDGSDPRGWYDPATGTGVAGATNGTLYNGPITINGNARVVARARQANKWQNTWSGPTAASLYSSIPALRITEIMYHPANPPQPSPFRDEDFEFIEVRNTSGGSLNVTGYKIRGGIDFLFPNLTLTAGQRAVVVRNRAAFSALYNTNGMIIAGEFGGGGTNNLDNTGERLILEGRFGEPILDFRYDDDWHKITDGLGFSLVIADDTLPTPAWDNPANWRVGGVVNGTPGAGEPAPATFPQVVVNEALTHTDEETAFDTIELRNLGATPADISYWFLSDDRLAVKKFWIPEGTIIPANGFITFTESDFNFGPNGFSLSAQGDELFLASANAAGDLTGYLHGFSFGAQRNGVTFGRHVTSVGKEAFVAQAANTLNAANAGPLIGNVVISEIHYHPQLIYGNGAYWNNNDDEYIELYNRSGSPVNLYHPSDPNLVWKLEKAVEFDFPPGTSIPAGGYVVLVNFNPATKPGMATAFRARFNIPAGVPLMGPLRGDLSNDEETVALYQPDNPVTNVNGVLEFPYVLVEEVQYSDLAPWPIAADGAGSSLQRRLPPQYADDPISWEASWPSAGRAYVAGAGPSITSQPTDTSILEGNPLTMSVTADAPPASGPLRYQWRKAGANIGGQTNRILNIDSAVIADSGEYNVFVQNNSGFATSIVARATVRAGVRILQHPASLTVRSPSNVTFSVVATTTNVSGITYQWKFNGQDLPGETRTNLVINNVTNIHDGTYQVVCTDGNGPVISRPAILTVWILPRMIWPNPAAPLRLTAVAGETLTVSAELYGTLPIFTRWRMARNSGGTPTIGADQTNTQLQVTKSFVVATNDTGRVLIGFTNVAGGGLGSTSFFTNAFLTVLVDTDGDGIPDVYEQANGMNDHDASDANGDLDGDTSRNKDEYIAGTDPRDPTSYLKVDRIAVSGAALLQFSAVSNRSYTVQFNDSLSSLNWQPVASVAGRSTNWTATAVDPVSPPQRYYRLVTPAQ